MDEACRNAIKYLIKHSQMQHFMFIMFLISLIMTTCFGNHIPIIRSFLYMHVMSNDFLIHFI
jgi:hypothetical protein